MIPFSDARVLVTGGAGFIGSALVWALNRRGCERIVVGDFLESGDKWRNLAPLAFEEYLEADVLIEQLERGALGTFDVILHMGACSATTETDARYLAQNNYEYTKRIAARALSQHTRLVYASSAATYGDGTRGMRDTSDPDELQTLRPLNMYGYSKQLFDLHAARHRMLDRIAGVKFFNIFGPNESHKGDMRSLVNKAYAQVVETGEIRLFRSYRPDYADGEQMRDFLYVKDAAEMTLHLASSESANGLFNVGSGEAHTWSQLATAVFAALDRPPAIRFIDMPASLRARYQYFTQADIGRLRATGYDAPVTPLAEAVAEYVRGYLVPDRRLGDEPAG